MQPDPDDPIALPLRASGKAPTRRRARAGSALLATLVTFGGYSVDSHAAAPVLPDTARVIVRFGPEVVDPADPAFLKALAASARIGRIELIRAMSGDAYVMRIVCGDPAQQPAPDPCEAAIARLRAAGPVRMIEPDGRETTR